MEVVCKESFRRGVEDWGNEMGWNGGNAEAGLKKNLWEGYETISQCNIDEYINKQ